MDRYSRPSFLPERVTTEQYKRWLDRKAAAHLRRDRKRGNKSATKTKYKVAIHQAVVESGGCDAYTSELLDWTIISKYDNDSAKANGRLYKKQFGLLPTVDHVGDGLGAADFRICAWRTNDAKNDLDIDEFLAVCRAVLEHMTTIETRVDRELLLEFFLTFAKFEYALKNTDCFIRHPEDPRRLSPAEPDWDRFAASRRDDFNPKKSEELAAACRYLSESPPNRQVIVNGSPAWETPVHDPGLSEIEFLLRMVRSVRNNLFHGGKHNIAIHESRERTEKLLRSCLALLNECLSLAPTQKRAYREAML